MAITPVGIATNAVHAVKTLK